MASDNSFWEAYKHPLWQKKSAEIRERAGYRCENCGGEDKTLHTHHGCYLRNRKPWEYSNETLHCLCEECHESIQKLQDDLKLAIGHFVWPMQILGYCEGVRARDNLDYRFELLCHDHACGVADAWGLDADSIIEARDRDGDFVDGHTLHGLELVRDGVFSKGAPCPQ